MRLYILPLLLLVGCGSTISAEHMVGPNGKGGYLVKCLHADKLECDLEAGRYCRYGYDVVSSSTRGHSLIVECKSPPTN
jgi:hypothetical protein